MTINRSYVLTTALIWAVFLGWQCKEKPSEPQVEKVPLEVKKPTPKIILELAEFADLSLSETVKIDELLKIKEIDSNGLVKDMEIDKAARVFKQKMTAKESTRYPLLEIQNSDRFVVIFQGKGYGGAIWAFVLFNKKDQSIAKLSLNHLAESDGFGAAMTYSSFENQFIGRHISSDSQNFGLTQSTIQLMDGPHQIDGLAGATISSKAVVEMMNSGLASYHTYLTGEHD